MRRLLGGREELTATNVFSACSGRVEEDKKNGWWKEEVLESIQIKG